MHKTKQDSYIATHFRLLLSLFLLITKKSKIANIWAVSTWLQNRYSAHSMFITWDMITELQIGRV